MRSANGKNSKAGAAGKEVHGTEKISESRKPSEDGEKEDYCVSSQKALQPPAICLNIEEVAKIFDELLAYYIFQCRNLLDDCVALSYKEMKEKMDEKDTPFSHQKFFFPTIIDKNTNLPIPPTKAEYFEWFHGDGRTRWGNVQKWQQKARTSVFRSGLKQIEDDHGCGVAYDPTCNLNAMDA